MISVFNQTVGEARQAIDIQIDVIFLFLYDRNRRKVMPIEECNALGQKWFAVEVKP